ncbi:MAG: NAD(+) synthetase [Candidatus Methanomethylicota archaeon]|uniref:NH(3)-dependent NAD(+) synthetase n=1 Tax=Thermoproteota archaeon TaxID=2056631 RepID=A0A497F2H7_9CREN|nr:MAG: NAD(+) synthetase [Candidatus Verstraetearchaeota archaeon]
MVVGYDLSIDVEKVERKILDFIVEYVRKTGSSGVVVGLSGGVDSSTVATLCTKALGKDRVFAMIMPEEDVTPEEDVKDALMLAERLGLKHGFIKINDLYGNFVNHLNWVRSNVVVQGNLKARIRMCILYYVANSLNMLVAGASDRSEILIGYFTKYGDGGVDFLPIGGLYKTQVRMLAAHLGLPKHIVEKPSSPRLWAGHTAEGELGLSYEIIDQVLHGLFDRKFSYAKVAEDVGVSVEVVKSIANRVRKSGHKRRTPPIAPVK